MEDIKHRLERGYTMSIYGTREALHEQMRSDIEQLLEALRTGSVSKCYTEKDMERAYDRGFNDGNQRDLTGSLIEVL